MEKILDVALKICQYARFLRSIAVVITIVLVSGELLYS